jgi:hypothetical protein
VGYSPYKTCFNDNLVQFSSVYHSIISDTGVVQLRLDQHNTYLRLPTTMIMPLISMAHATDSGGQKMLGVARQAAILEAVWHKIIQKLMKTLSFRIPILKQIQLSLLDHLISLYNLDSIANSVACAPNSPSISQTLEFIPMLCNQSINFVPVGSILWQ